jgi:uncharacterized repeat protein (TIGR04076 family)
MERHDVKVKIVSQKGTCVLEHKEGDEWVFSATSPAGLCMAAFTALAPFIRTLQYGGEYEWPLGSGTLQLCCPDPFNPVIFEITKIPGSSKDIEPQSSWL